MEKSTDKYIGKILDDRYEILELIGAGGMANVYKALCHRLNRYDAVKIMRDDTAADECFRKRFRTESQAVAMLSHPNIVSVYDVSHNENIEYIVMELVDGITLKQYMKEHGALPTDEVLNFSIQIAKALAHAHSKGIIHRDIKPQNVMLLKDGLIKVADFGIAALQNDIEESTNETVGSVHYIAPEQARGAAADARSDIYSLGIVMYEMMTGRLPYVGKSDVEVAVKHMNTEAVPPRTIVPGIPEELERICLKAMATDITDRYQSAGELLSDLEQFRKQLAEASALKADVSSQSIETENIEVEDAGRRKRKKKSKFALGSGVIAVLILIILVFVFVNGYFIKDLFSTPDKVDVPSFIGRYYEDVINDADYESQFKFTVTVKVDTDKELVTEVEQKDVSLIGIDGFIERQVAMDQKSMARELERAFFSAAATAGTLVELTGITDACEKVEKLIQSVETVKNDYVDGVERDMIAVVCTPAMYAAMRTYFDKVQGGDAAAASFGT